MAGRYFLELFALGESGAVAQRGRYGDGGEGGGTEGGCDHDAPGAKDLQPSFHGGGGYRGGAIWWQVGEQGG